MRTSESRINSTGAWRWSRPIVAAGLAAALVATSSSAANAQVVEHPDAAGDVVAESYETGKVQPAPDHVRNDARATTLAHTATRVSVRIGYAEMQRVGHANGLFLVMVTNEGVRRGVEVVAGPGDWAGDAEMWRGDERSVRCAIRVSMDYADNVTSVSFPRRCLSSPRWVRFRAVSWAFEGDSFYTDDALSDDPYSEGIRSERIYRAASR